MTPVLIFGKNPVLSVSTGFYFDVHVQRRDAVLFRFRTLLQSLYPSV